MAELQAAQSAGSKTTDSQLRPPVLLALVVTRDVDAEPDQVEASKLQLYYQARAAIADKGDHQTIYHVEFVAGQRYDENTLFEATADYVVALSTEFQKSENYETLLKSAVVSIAWSQFRVLFSTVVAHSALNLPQLPMEADVSIVELNEIVGNNDEAS